MSNSYSNDYNKGVLIIKNALNGQDVMKTESKASVYDYWQTINKYFGGFYDTFSRYSNYQIDNSIYKMTLFPEYSLFNNELVLWVNIFEDSNKSSKKKESYLLLTKELNSNFFRYNPDWVHDDYLSRNSYKATDSYLRNIIINIVEKKKDIFLDVFNLMEEYCDYSDYLGIITANNWKKDSYRHYPQNNLCCRIKIHGNGMISTEIEFNDLESDVVHSMRSDGKPSLEQLLINNKDELLKKSPISIHEMGCSTRKIYQEYWNSYGYMPGVDEKIYLKK